MQIHIDQKVKESKKNILSQVHGNTHTHTHARLKKQKHVLKNNV